MLRLPSVQKTYDEYYTGDPAFVQLDDNASADARAEHERKLKLARLTGNWSDLLVEPTAKPTKFGFRIIPSEMRRKLVDMIGASENARLSLEWIALCFRGAIVDVANLGDVRVAKVKHPEFGVIASTDICDLLDGIDPQIVNELGLRAWERSNVRDPT